MVEIITVAGILFDMDGTLCDSTPAVEKTMREWCGKQNVVEEEFFAVSHGVRTRDNVRKFQTVPVPGSELSEDELTKTVDEIEFNIAENGRLLAEAGGKGITLLPGVGKLLQALKDGGARWGIVTSATTIYANSAMSTSGIITPPFRITGNDCHYGKPHPEPYQKGLEQLRALPGPAFSSSDVLVFEDAPSGLTSGLAAGCRTLAVTTSHSRKLIEGLEATYKVIDLKRVEVVRADRESVTLRLKTLEDEEEL